MKIDISTWREFRIGDLFDLQTGKVNSKMEQLEDGENCLYLGATKKRNCVLSRCNYSVGLAQKGNCILFICDGQGSVGYTNYIDRDFIATVNIVAGYNSYLNPYVGLFLVTVFDLERPKYSYGRKWKTHLADTKVLLPALEASGEPDWQYMEDYIKSLPALNTCLSKLSDTNLMSCEPLNLMQDFLIGKDKCVALLLRGDWKKYKIGKLFNIEKGKRLTDADKVEGKLPFIGAIDSCNGVSSYIDEQPVHSGNVITVNYNGSVGEAFYQPVPFWASDDVNVLYPNGWELNPAIGLFICTVIRNEKYRFSYGRKWKLDRMEESEIWLPSDNDGNPDWQYMEDYIKSLPAGDKLANL